MTFNDIIPVTPLSQVGTSETLNDINLQSVSFVYECING